MSGSTEERYLERELIPVNLVPTSKGDANCHQLTYDPCSLLRPIDKIDADNLIIIIVSKYLSIISISVQWTLRRLVERKLSFEKLRALVTNRLSLIGKNILLLDKSALVTILMEGS